MLLQRKEPVGIFSTIHKFFDDHFYQVIVRIGALLHISTVRFTYQQSDEGIPVLNPVLFFGGITALINIPEDDPQGVRIDATLSNGSARSFSSSLGIAIEHKAGKFGIETTPISPRQGFSSSGGRGSGALLVTS